MLADGELQQLEGVDVEEWVVGRVDSLRSCSRQGDFVLVSTSESSHDVLAHVDLCSHKSPNDANACLSRQHRVSRSLDPGESMLLLVLEGGFFSDFFFPLRQPQMFDTQQL
jgi:hypothetical protein